MVNRYSTKRVSTFRKVGSSLKISPEILGNFLLCSFGNTVSLGIDLHTHIHTHGGGGVGIFKANEHNHDRTKHSTTDVKNLTDLAIYKCS